MRLADLCEPLFQYACLLSRSARQGATRSIGQIRSELDGIFDDMRTRAAADPKLKAAFERVELILMIFVDWTIKESGPKFGEEWPSLALERGQENGEEYFFDALDDALRDSSGQAVEALTVFYTCVGLGFTGWYAGQPEHLRKRQREIAARLRIVADADRATRIVPEAYEHVDTSNLIESPKTSLVGIGIALIGLTAVLFAANWFTYRTSARDLERALDNITKSAPP
jgi:type VI protein secretion system component VasF